MAEKIVFFLTFVIGALTMACMFVTVPPSRKALRSGQPITAPLLSDRRLIALYVLLGLQAAVMLAQLILGLVAGYPFGRTFLMVLAVDARSTVLYGIPILSLFYIHQTRKAKKQMEENGGEPLPAMTHEEAQKTPRMRSFRVLLIVLAAIGILIGVLALALKGSDAQNTVLIIAVVVVFVLAPLAVLVHWLIFRRK